MRTVKGILIFFAAVLLAAALSACLNVKAAVPAVPDGTALAEPASKPPPPSVPSIPAETPSSSPEPSGGPQEDPGDDVPSVTVTFAGDVLIDRGIRNLYASQGFGGVFSEDDDIKARSDILMVNLENPFSTRGEPMEDKEWTFLGDPKHIPFLSDLGVDIVSVANNHTLDFGQAAFLDTLEHLTANGIAYVGGGADLEEAGGYKIFEVNGIKIAFLAASNVLPSVSWYATKTRPGLFAAYDPRALVAKIAEASEAADHVVVYVHWGVERSPEPEEWQRTKARQFIDAGASCVIGSHPHVLQGIEFYTGKPIIYSLGDFIFPTGNKDTMTASVTFGEEISVSLKPYMIRNLKTVPAEDDGDVGRILSHLRDISFDVSIGDDFSVRPLYGD